MAAGNHSSLELPSRGGPVPTLCYRPAGPGPHPAVVAVPEAYGVNAFTRQVAGRLADAGYLTLVPDYYRGEGPSDPEGYDDFTEVIDCIDRLDFTRGTHDVLAAIDHARGLPDVDAERVGVWGYCTGGTLAMLAAALDRRLAAAVWFFPSQPTFPELTPRRPLQPIDLLWAVTCPVLLVVGGRDEMLVSALPEFRRRFEQWEVRHEIRVYEGGGHAFSAPVAPLRHDESDRASWADAIRFAERHLG